MMKYTLKRLVWIQAYLIYVSQEPQQERGEKGQKKTFEEIMAENFKNLIKSLNLVTKMLNEPRAL